jgi:hypothetical protein
VNYHPSIKKWVGLPYFKQVSATEYCSACPSCGEFDHDSSSGEPDRFRIFPEGTGKTGVARAWCRRCQHKEFSFPTGYDKRDPAGQARMAQLHQEMLEKAEEEIQRLHKMIAWLARSQFWLSAHEGMNQAQRQTWLKHVPSWAIDMHCLGFFDHDLHVHGPESDVFVRGDSLSIPYLEGGVEPEHIQSLQLRMLNPDEGGKYRFLPGFKGSDRLFFPYPEHTHMDEVVIVVEGAKKSIWLFDELSDIEYRGQSATIVALPNKWLEYASVARFEDSKVVIWMLDPDAHWPDKNGNVTAEINANKVGREKSRFVRLPGKVDDLITSGVYKNKHLKALINQAGTV